MLALLVWIVIRYNAKANPVPAKFSHNTPIEIIWTVVPVLILMFIAIFSFPLLFNYHDMPKPDLTVKATGYQWYWGYEYPDQKIAEYTSNIAARGQGRGQRRALHAGGRQPAGGAGEQDRSRCWSPAPT